MIFCPGFVPGRPGTEELVPGRPGTEELVPGFLHLSLSRDKGTAGQPKLFCPGTMGQWDRETFFFPGQRDNGMSRPLETLVNALSTLHGILETAALFLHKL